MKPFLFHYDFGCKIFYGFVPGERGEETHIEDGKREREIKKMGETKSQLRGRERGKEEEIKGKLEIFSRPIYSCLKSNV